MPFFIATLFLRLKKRCDGGMENIRNRASPAPAKLQLVPTPLLEGRIKIEPRPHQEDPASSLIQQCPYREASPTQVAVHTRVATAPMTCTTVVPTVF